MSARPAYCAYKSSGTADACIVSRASTQRQRRRGRTRSPRTPGAGPIAGGRPGFTRGSPARGRTRAILRYSVSRLICSTCAARFLFHVDGARARGGCARARRRAAAAGPGPRAASPGPPGCRNCRSFGRTTPSWADSAARDTVVSSSRMLPGHGIGHQQVERLGRQLPRVERQAVGRAVARQEPIREHRDVDRPLPQRGQPDRERVDAVVEILAERAVRDERLERAVGRADEPEVHVDARRGRPGARPGAPR